MIRRPHALVVRCTQPVDDVCIAQVASIGNVGALRRQVGSVARVQNEVDAILDAPQTGAAEEPASSGPTSQGDIDKLFA